MAFSRFTPAWVQPFAPFASFLDPRSAPRLLRLLLGAVLAVGRRTVTSWIRAASLSDDFRPCYSTLAAAGRRIDPLAGLFAHRVVRPLLPDSGRILLAIDDTPTERPGPEVQGAGIHHNPTPGPAGSAFLRGHCWVVLGLLACHPAWGVIALPLLARLYVRRKDLPPIPEAVRPTFRTKLELAVELVRWALTWVAGPGRPVWVVADGAFAKRPFLKPLTRAGVTVVSRLRRDAALCSVPGPKPQCRRGPQATYGKSRVDLAARAGRRRGWQSGTFVLYGESTTKRYKTFLATWRPAGGLIRVVLVDEPRGWVAFFCTDPGASAADILGAVADRFSLETAFRDLKQVEGAGEQQVRKLATNVGAFHVCVWSYVLTESWAWGRPPGELADRSGSPWDDPNRRPSHADKRRALRRELLGEEIRAALRSGADEAEILAVADRVLTLAA